MQGDVTIPAQDVPGLFLCILAAETFFAGVIDGETVDGQVVPSTDLDVVGRASKGLKTARQIKKQLKNGRMIHAS